MRSIFCNAQISHTQPPDRDQQARNQPAGTGRCLRRPGWRIVLARVRCSVPLEPESPSRDSQIQLSVRIFSNPLAILLRRKRLDMTSGSTEPTIAVRTRLRKLRSRATLGAWDCEWTGSIDLRPYNDAEQNVTIRNITSALSGAKPERQKREGDGHDAEETR